MTPEAVALVVAALTTSEPSWRPAWPSPLSITAAPPTYLATERAVDNWRLESSLALDLAPIAAIRLAAGGDLAQTPRCIKLNNYWCVKHGGWVGEIAADSEGHVAFATADHGAAVAAQLLRRYYIDYKRRSARAIVSRWAPARCAPPALLPKPAPVAPIIANSRPPEPPPRPPMTKSGRTAAVASAAPPKAPAPQLAAQRMMPQRVVAMGLAPHGIENTLRARWLAAHGRGGVAAGPRAARSRPSRAPADARLAMAPAPAIAVGMGESSQRPAIGAATALPPAASAKLTEPLRPIESCVGEKERLANYAARVIAGVVAGPDDDLALFSADGAPTDNLAKVMANMAAVEIGPLRASNVVIAAGIAQMTRLLAKGKSAAATAPGAEAAPTSP